MLPKKLKILPALILLLFVSTGCNGQLPEGMGRKPRITVGEAPKFTPEEMAVLKTLATEHPAIAKKIIGRNNELAAAVEEYNRQAAKTNFKLYTALGHSPDEARAILKSTGFTDEEIKGAS